MFFSGICNAPAASRTDCGYPGISRLECENKNCCYTDGPPYVNLCFFPQGTGAHWSALANFKKYCFNGKTCNFDSDITSDT